VSSLVKTWLVVMLALVLPLEGAVAAAGMLCHARPSAASAPQAHTGAHHGAHEVGQRVAPRRGPQASDATSARGDPSARIAVDPSLADPSLVDPLAIDPPTATAFNAGCPACSGACSASPLPASHALSLATDPVARAHPAPAHLAPPSHVAAGLERPPRSV
jgi:hypothetical protein